jgi:hypothetical protein
MAWTAAIPIGMTGMFVHVYTRTLEDLPSGDYTTRVEKFNANFEWDEVGFGEVHIP